MPKVDMKLYSTDTGTGSKITTSVTYINPETSNTVLKTFAQKLNAFTTNNYTSADRVETVNLDTASDSKQFRDISITGATRGGTATITLTIGEGETVTPVVFFYVSSNDVRFLTATAAQVTDIPTIGTSTVSIPNAGGWLYIGTGGKEQFYSELIIQEVS